MLFTVTVYGKLLTFYLFYRFCGFEGRFLDIVHQGRGTVIVFYCHVLKAEIVLNFPRNLNSPTSSAMAFLVGLQSIIFLVQPGTVENLSENRAQLRTMELAVLLVRLSFGKQFLLGSSTKVEMSCPWSRIHLYYLFST